MRLRSSRASSRVRLGHSSRRADSHRLSIGQRVLWWGMIAGILIGLLTLLKSLLNLLLIAAATAYLLDPLVDRLEQRGFRREAGVLILASASSVLFILSGLIVVQAVALEVQELSGKIQGYLDSVVLNLQLLITRIEEETQRPIPNSIEAFVEELKRQLSTMSSADQDGLSKLLRDAAPDLGELILTGTKGLLGQGVGLVFTVLNLLLLPIFTFYLLVDWDRMVSGARELVPLRYRARLFPLLSTIDDRIANFVRGQITICFVMGLLYSLGLLLCSIDLALLIGMLSGALFIVPYLGTIVGLVMGSTLALLEFGLDWHLLGVWATFAVVQGLEGFLLTPRVMGDKVGLHPLVVMIALLVAGNLLGLWGMLIAIPLTAAGQVMMTEWLLSYKASDFYTRRQA